jgi:MFS transporter, OFA family, oxalate/formate antiporter
MLYTAKGSGALLVPVAAAIAKSNGWGDVFMIAMSFNILAAILALVVLKPLRARHFAISKATFAPTPGATDTMRRTT